MPTRLLRSRHSLGGFLDELIRRNRIISKVKSKRWRRRISLESKIPRKWDALSRLIGRRGPPSGATQWTERIMKDSVAFEEWDETVEQTGETVGSLSDTRKIRVK